MSLNLFAEKAKVLAAAGLAVRPNSRNEIGLFVPASNPAVSYLGRHFAFHLRKPVFALWRQGALGSREISSHRIQDNPVNKIKTLTRHDLAIVSPGHCGGYCSAWAI